MAKEVNKDQEQILNQVMQDIEKQFGKGAIMRLGGDAKMEIDTGQGQRGLQ